MLHLHRLEDEQRRALVDRRAGRDEQRDDLARHRREQAGALLVVLGAGDAERVDEVENERAAGDEDMATLALRDDRRGDAAGAQRGVDRPVAANARRRRDARAVELELPRAADERGRVDLAKPLALAKAEPARRPAVDAPAVVQRPRRAGSLDRSATRRAATLSRSTSASPATSQASAGGSTGAGNSAPARAR